MMYRKKYISLMDSVKASDSFKDKTIDDLLQASKNKNAFNMGRNRIKVTFTGIGVACCLLLLSIYGFSGMFQKGTNEVLPMLNISAGNEAMGCEGYLAYNIEDMFAKDSVLDTKELKSMPVYKNHAVGDGAGLISGGLTDEKMKACIEKAATALGESVKRFESNMVELQGYCDTIKIRAERDGTIYIEFNCPVSSVDQKELDNEDSRAVYELILDKLQKNYSTLLKFKKSTPCIDLNYTYDGNKLWPLSTYEGEGDFIQQIINKSLNRVYFYLDERKNLSSIRIYRKDLSEKIGDYPIITAEQAKKQLLEGRYFTSIGYKFPGESEIKFVELAYRNSVFEDYFIPFYKFYIRLPQETRDNGLNMYGVYYVPAVEAQYIENWQLKNETFQQ